MRYLATTLIPLALLSFSAHGLDNRIRANPSIMDYVPIDLKPANVQLANRAKVMRECAYTDGHPGQCIGYCSEQDASCWVIRYLPSGTVERIYTVFGDKLELWMKAGPSPTYTPVFLSPGAKRFAIEKQKALMRRAQKLRPEDCKRSTGLERKHCEMSLEVPNK